MRGELERTQIRVFQFASPVVDPSSLFTGDKRPDGDVLRHSSGDPRSRPVRARMCSFGPMKRTQRCLGIDPRVVGEGEPDVGSSLEPLAAHDTTKLGYERAQR